MTPRPEHPDPVRGDSTPGGPTGSGDTDRLVTRAADALRSHVEPGWVDARDRIRSVALSATRNTWPLALRDQPGLFVSDQVVISLLRQVLDTVDHIRATAIYLTPAADPSDVVDLVTIEVVVDYPHPIAPLTAQVRRHCLALVHDLLAPLPDDAGGRPPVDIAVVSVTDPSVHG